MVNPQDTTLSVQAAIKNIATNTVFYFVIPVEMEAIFSSGTTMDVGSFATAWKNMDESHEATVVIKGRERGMLMGVCLSDGTMCA